MGNQTSGSSSRERLSERRKSERVFLVIPLEVQWTEPDGKHVKERAETEIISATGAQLRMKKTPPTSAELELSRSTFELTTRARVVNTSPQEADGWIRSTIELFSPSSSFWGVSLPPPSRI